MDRKTAILVWVKHLYGKAPHTSPECFLNRCEACEFAGSTDAINHLCVLLTFHTGTLRRRILIAKHAFDKEHHDEQHA